MAVIVVGVGVDVGIGVEPSSRQKPVALPTQPVINALLMTLYKGQNQRFRHPGLDPGSIDFKYLWMPDRIRHGH